MRWPFSFTSACFLYSKIAWQNCIFVILNSVPGLWTATILQVVWGNEHDGMAIVVPHIAYAFLGLKKWPYLSSGIIFT